jgi:transposase
MIPSGARVWIARGHTDMRRGMQGLALMVQQHLGRDPFAGDLWVFRGRTGSLIKIVWHDGIGMSLYAKRLEKGRFVWRQAKDGVVALEPCPACLPARRDRLAQPAVQLASGERRVGRDFSVTERHFPVASEAPG